MKYFTLLLIAFATLTTQAQYIDLIQPDTTLHWLAAHDNTSLSGTTHSETSEFFTGRTVSIRGMSYAETDNGLQHMHFREDGQHRIYALDPNDTVETLLFAFDAQVGDTIRFHGFIGDSTRMSHDYYYAVDSAGSMVVNGTTRRVLHVSTDIPSGQPGFFFPLTWIEGIGEQHFGLHSVFVPDLYNGYSFCGVHTDSGYIYTASLNCYELLSAKDLAQAEQIHLYPIPATDAVAIENNSTERLTSYQVADLMGQRVAEGSLAYTTAGIPVSALAPGAYIVLLRDDAGHIFQQRIIKQ